MLFSLQKNSFKVRILWRSKSFIFLKVRLQLLSTYIQIFQHFLLYKMKYLWGLRFYNYLIEFFFNFHLHVVSLQFVKTVSILQPHNFKLTIIGEINWMAYIHCQNFSCEKIKLSFPTFSPNCNLSHIHLKLEHFENDITVT